MKDIARDVGVSVVTVSKVLRNHTDIGLETRRRVLKRARELNYRPNLAARALVTGRSRMAGFIVPDLVHPFFAEVAKSLSKVLRDNDYSLVISSSEEDPELERREIDGLLARGVDVLILASTQWTVESFRRVEELGTPYVLIDRNFVGLPANFVGVDDEKVGHLATEHLIEQGCKRIAHIRGTETSASAGRLEGYRRALREHGLSISSDRIIAGLSPDAAGDVSGYDAMQQLLRLDPRPDAVFCFNDPIGLGVLKAIHGAGLRAPDDIAVVGCGNVMYADLLRTPLTSVDQQSPVIGERAALLALKLIDAKEPIRPSEILLEPRIVARASSLKKH